MTSLFKSFKQILRPWKYQLKTAEARIGILEKHVTALQEQLRDLLIESGAYRNFQDLMQPLAPHKCSDFLKARIGTSEDGGYIMLNDFKGIESAISIGIAKEVSWDLAMAKMGIPIIQFDPSIDGPPIQNSLFTFAKKKVVREVADSAKEWSLTGLPAPVQKGNRGSILLKIDIEGNEWDVLDGLSLDDLSYFRQIVVEFHDLHLYRNPSWREKAGRVFSKLTEQHRLIHVHGNNFNTTFAAGVRDCPRDLEMTFVLKNHYNLEVSGETFPTPLDRPSKPSIKDYPLGDFRF